MTDTRPWRGIFELNYQPQMSEAYKDALRAKIERLESETEPIRRCVEHVRAEYEEAQQALTRHEQRIAEAKDELERLA